MRFLTEIEDHGARAALITNSKSVSYAELILSADLFTDAVRATLSDTCTKPLILLEAANEFDAIFAYVGALRAGWPTILAAKDSARRQSLIAQSYLPNIIVCAQSNWQPVLVNPDSIDMHPDIAVLLSTSGTTGAPKLVRLSHQNLLANATAIANYLDVKPDDRALTLLPYHYSYGMSVLHIHLLRGAGVVLTDKSIVDEDLRVLAQHTRVTSLALVPTQFELLDTIEWLPQLRYITQAGGRLDPLLAQKFAAKASAEAWNLFIMYGQTEAGPRMSYVPAQDAETWFHTIGLPLEGGVFRLVDNEGDVIAGTRQTGELVYEGPNVMLGYAITQVDLCAPAGPSVLYTGDMAERLENGYFRITGRASRFIKLFGLRIGLDDVEAQLRADGWRVYASGSDERLVIFVTVNCDTGDLQMQVAQRFGLPRSAVAVEYLEDVPVLPSSKVDYRSLARRAEAVITATSEHHDTNALLQQILRTQTPDLDQSFLEAGGDSLAYLEMQLHLLSKLGDVPNNWENLPLRQILVLENSATDVNTGGGINVQPIRADLLIRVFAILAIVALHSTTWPAGGGAYTLLIMVGYSLAKFQGTQLFDGHILKVLRSMLVPILVCYYLVIGAASFARAPIDLQWFLLLGNFQTEVPFRGLIPYWFVSAYSQIITLFTLPFLIPTVRRLTRRNPLYIGIVVLIVVVLIFMLIGGDNIKPHLRHRHPLGALELLILGWCIFFAKGKWQTIFILAVVAFVWSVSWRDLDFKSSIFVLLSALLLVINFEINVPSLIAKILMRFGSLTLFIYIVHAPTISLVYGLGKTPNLIRYLLVLFISIFVALVLKWFYEMLSYKVYKFFIFINR